MAENKSADMTHVTGPLAGVFNVVATATGAVKSMQDENSGADKQIEQPTGTASVIPSRTEATLMRMGFATNSSDKGSMSFNGNDIMLNLRRMYNIQQHIDQLSSTSMGATSPAMQELKKALQAETDTNEKYADVLKTFDGVSMDDYKKLFEEQIATDKPKIAKTRQRSDEANAALGLSTNLSEFQDNADRDITD